MPNLSLSSRLLLGRVSRGHWNHPECKPLEREKPEISTRSGKALLDEPEIGDVDEGVVERGENTGDAEDEFAYEELLEQVREWGVGMSDQLFLPSLTWGPREMFSVAPRSTFFFGGIFVSGFRR